MQGVFAPCFSAMVAGAALTGFGYGVAALFIGDCAGIGIERKEKCVMDSQNVN